MAQGYGQGSIKIQRREPLVWERVTWRQGDGRYVFEVAEGGLHATLSSPHGTSLTLPMVAWEGLLDALAGARKTRARGERGFPVRSGARWYEGEAGELVAGVQGWPHHSAAGSGPQPQRICGRGPAGPHGAVGPRGTSAGRARARSQPIRAAAGGCSTTVRAEDRRQFPWAEDRALGSSVRQDGAARHGGTRHGNTTFCWPATLSRASKASRTRSSAPTPSRTWRRSPASP